MHKKSVIGLFLFLLVITGGTAVFAGTGDLVKDSPHLSIRASMGGSFRTVDVTVTLESEENFARLYYLALPTGSEAPSLSQIINYVNGSETAGLTDGTAVRGRWIAASSYNNTAFSLEGAENVNRLPNETGFIDGYRYDVYLTAICPSGARTPVIAAKNVMAQPFDAMSADQKTFTIRALNEADIKNRFPDLSDGYPQTARQLQNIQRLADLYIETKGMHGSMDFLTDSDFTYVLDADLELYGNWKPIGNADANPRFVFRGSFDGKNNTIRGLHMDKDTGRDGQSYEIQGLFGKLEDATVRNLILDNTELRVAGDFGRRSFSTGVLAGEVKNGTIDHITVTNASVTAFGSDAGYGDVGGVIGKASDTHLYDITVNRTKVTTFDPSRLDYYAGTTGGIIGRYTATKGNGLLNNLSATAVIKTSAPAGGWDTSGNICAGGIAGLVESDNGKETAIHAENWYSGCVVTGGNCTGGLVGQIAGEHIIFDAARFDGRVAGYGLTGGLFGVASCENERSLVIKNADAAGYTEAWTVKKGDVAGADNLCLLGGMAGLLKGCVIEHCFSRGPGLAADKADSDGTGGLAGRVEDSYVYQSYVRRDVGGSDRSGGFVGTAVRSDFQSCGVESGEITGSLDTGGFVGLVQESGHFYDCYSAARVKAASRVGGFAGAVRGKKLTANANHVLQFVLCRAMGSVSASGGQAGGFAGVLNYAYAERCQASGFVRANAVEAGGFCGRLANMSRVVNARAVGEVINTDRIAGGFTGLITNASCVEYAYAAGNVTGYDETGGFAGYITAYGAPNTLTNCLSFANRVVSPAESTYTRRFVGRLDHPGVNDCYAYLGGVVTTGQTLTTVNPSAYGADGADMNGSNLHEVLTRLNWSTDTGLPYFNAVK